MLDHLIWRDLCANQTTSGGSVPDDTRGSPAVDHDTSRGPAALVSSSPAAGPSVVPVGTHITNTPSRKETDGSGTTTPASSMSCGPDTTATRTPTGTAGCRCGHSATAHSRYGPCTADGCLCDRYAKPRKTNAAG